MAHRRRPNDEHRSSAIRSSAWLYFSGSNYPTRGIGSSAGWAEFLPTTPTNMNEETSKLIQQLADKLGTTAEHLWAVLCRQAPISATVDSVLCIAAVAAAWGAFRLVQRKTTRVKTKSESGYERESAEWEDEPAFLAWLLWIVLAVIACAIIVTSASGIAAGFVNPEYWALKQIIK